MAKRTEIGCPVTLQSADGTRIACQVAGPPNGHPVVLTSGIGCGPVFYRHIAPELAKRYRVIYWDYRAHGQSGPAPDKRSYSIPDHASDLETVVQSLTRQPPIMVGFSMGVQVTVEWARRWADQSAGYVFLLGMPCNPLRRHWAFGKALLRNAAGTALDAGAQHAMPFVHPLSRAVLRSRLSYEVALRTGLISPFFTKDDFDEFIHYSSAIAPDAYLRCGIGVLEHDAIDTWTQLDSPILYFAGAHDLLVKAAECAEVSSLLVRHAKYEQLDGASHAGTVEAGVALARRIREFVEANTRPGNPGSRDPRIRGSMAPHRSEPARRISRANRARRQPTPAIASRAVVHKAG